MAPWGRDTEHLQSQDIRRTIKANATSSLFLVKIIAKLERTLSNVYKTKTKHRNPQNNKRYIKQWINNNRSTNLVPVAEKININSKNCLQSENISTCSSLELTQVAGSKDKHSATSLSTLTLPVDPAGTGWNHFALWLGVNQYDHRPLVSEEQILSPCGYKEYQQRPLAAMCGSREGGSGPPPPPPPMKNHKNIGFLSNSGQDPLKNHKATEPAFNVGPSSARQRNPT